MTQINVNTQVQAAPKTTGLQKFNSVITSPNWQSYLSKVLGERSGSFVNNVTALVANNANLQVCRPETIIYSAMKATSLNLPLDNNLGFAYVIPYNDTKNGVTDAQFQMGYKGFIQLAQRSNQMRTINVREVREGEFLGEDFVSGKLMFKMLPYDKRESAKVVGYVAYIELTGGFEKMEYWSVEKMDAHAERYSKTYGSKRKDIREKSLWTTDFDAMAKKTVLKALLQKYAPMNVELQRAIEADQAVFDEQGNASYKDNEETFEDVEAEVVETRENEQGKQEVSQEAKAAFDAEMPDNGNAAGKDGILF